MLKNIFFLNFFNKKRNWFTLLISLFFLFIFYFIYLNYKSSLLYNESIKYNYISKDFLNKEFTNMDFSDIKYINDFIDYNINNNLGILTSLKLSKYYFNRYEYNLSLEVLNRIFKYVKDTKLRYIIYLRLMKLYILTNRINDFLILFKDESYKDSVLQNIKFDLLGDFYYQKGNFDKAKYYWSVSRNMSPFELMKYLIQFKINNL